MACPVCQRAVIAGSCNDGYVVYLAGDFPCVYHPDPLAEVKNPRDLPPLVHRAPVPPPAVEWPNEVFSSKGLEDLL